MADIEKTVLIQSLSPDSYPIRGEAIDRALPRKGARIVILANYAERQYADALTAVNRYDAVPKKNPDANASRQTVRPGPAPLSKRRELIRWFTREVKALLAEAEAGVRRRAVPVERWWTGRAA